VTDELNYRFYEVELHRLKVELTLHQHSGANRCHKVEVEAEASYRRALQVARVQSAKSWELRAAISLVWLLKKQDRREDARAVLAPIYEWFSEGLDTRDPTEARALLEMLR
jgi:predicted ATPase